MTRFNGKNILVTGGKGFLGSFVVREIQKEGAKNITVPSSTEYDLRDKEVCIGLLKNQDIVVHLAANVGGIGLNRDHPGQLFYDNAMMGLNLLEAGRINRIKKLLIVGTACSYPKYCPVPFREENFWDGRLDEITGVYGMAKKMLLVAASSYRKEFGLITIYPILVNLYGPKDHFDPKYGHVISSLIYRLIEAKKKKSSVFTVWGSGSATREFLYVEDAARGLVSALKKYDGEEPVNIGTGKETSIYDLVQLLKEIIGFAGQIKWDSKQPDGQPRRCLDVTQAHKLFGFKAETSLGEGLQKTVSWYLKNYSK